MRERIKLTVARVQAVVFARAAVAAYFAGDVKQSVVDHHFKC